MKKYGLYRMIGESKINYGYGYEAAYGEIVVDNSPCLLEQYDDLDDALAEICYRNSGKTKFIDRHLYRYDLWYVAENENIGDDEDEVIVEKNIVEFALF